MVEDESLILRYGSNTVIESDSFVVTMSYYCHFIPKPTIKLKHLLLFVFNIIILITEINISIPDVLQYTHDVKSTFTGIVKILIRVAVGCFRKLIFSARSLAHPN